MKARARAFPTSGPGFLEPVSLLLAVLFWESYSESQLVLFLNGENDAYLRDRGFVVFRNHIYIRIYVQAL